MSLSISNLDWVEYNEELRTNAVDSWKTKDVFPRWSGVLALRHNWVITAGDDPEFTGISPEKWVTSAYSSALLFKRLEAAWVKTSHRGVLNTNTTLEESLDMLPFEVIWRKYNVKWNSWEKRNPGIVDIWARYDEVKYEACLKWSVVCENAEIVHDPFLVLDDSFQPLLNEKGLPRLMHSKEWRELTYSSVIKPNKANESVSDEELVWAMEQFAAYASEIRWITQKVQEVTWETYASIGRLNADGKIELWLNAEKELILWDELELDALRNMNLQTVLVDGRKYQFETDALWQDLWDLLSTSPEQVSMILQAWHSGKQYYRDIVMTRDGTPFDEERKTFNNQAAVETTNVIYIPTALALSERFSSDVWYLLKAV